MLNRAQKAVFLIGIIIILLLGLYPPWIHVCSFDKGKTKEERASIYGPIFNPPAEPIGKFKEKNIIQILNKDNNDAVMKMLIDFHETYRWNVFLDVPRLLIQWAMVIITVAGLCLVLKKPE
jgi:hypothetical protein